MKTAALSINIVRVQSIADKSRTVPNKQAPVHGKFHIWKFSAVSQGNEEVYIGSEKMVDVGNWLLWLN